MADTPNALGALREMVSVIDAAGALNLSRGVELGPTVWYVKCDDALKSARAVLSQPAEAMGVPDPQPVLRHEEMTGWHGDGPDLEPVARRYVQGRYTRASVHKGPGEGLVLQRDAAEWRQIARLRWKMIEQLTTERDALAAEALSQASARAGKDAADAARYRLIREAAKCDSKHGNGLSLDAGGRLKAVFAFRYWCEPEELDQKLDAFASVPARAALSAATDQPTKE